MIKVFSFLAVVLQKTTHMDSPVKQVSVLPLSAVFKKSHDFSINDNSSDLQKILAGYCLLFVLLPLEKKKLKF